MEYLHHTGSAVRRRRDLLEYAIMVVVSRRLDAAAEPNRWAASKTIIMSYLSMKQLCALCIILCLVGCSSGQQSSQPTTPSSTIAEDVLNNYRLIDDFQLFGTRSTPDNKIAGIYSYREMVNGSSTSFTRNMGYAVVEKVDGIHWKVTIKEEAIMSLPLKPDLPIDYFSFNGPTTYSVVFGQVFSTGVKTVEVTFADGVTGREEVTGDFYVIYSLSGSASCEIRALDENKQVLYSAQIYSPYSEESDACKAALKGN